MSERKKTLRMVIFLATMVVLRTPELRNPVLEFFGLRTPAPAKPALKPSIRPFPMYLTPPISPGMAMPGLATEPKTDSLPIVKIHGRPATLADMGHARLGLVPPEVVAAPKIGD